MTTLHQDLANGRWYTFTLAEQMGNIGSEVHRLIMAKNGDQSRFDSALDRALELIDLTLADPRWKKGYKEIARVREVLCDICFGLNQYDTSLEALDNYFFQFGLLAR
ncbi:hypothetical protein A3B60_02715 [Candidatus Peregrinibacteria bacterium RIFCSPLOWO2_01_FULL_39_12]|nr:MAG: hypothetical protein A3B60_02715 [Candidatus Peregrinibacteria bacterium RIFCSPLOWO2_01_FULL_39_12]